MKASLKYDIAVQIRHQEWEEEDDLAPFYRGIYSVTLNYFTTVMFIPTFPRTADNWPPTLPQDVDDVHSAAEARLFTAALSEYTVTPDAQLAGQQELIPLEPLPQIGPRMGLLFYVTPPEFALFSQELPLLEQKTPSVRDYVPLSQVRDFATMQLIRSHLMVNERNRERSQGVSSLFGTHYIKCLVPTH